MKFRLLFLLAFCALAFNAFAQITSVGIIGSATPTGWDSDTDMTQVNDSIWTISINLTGGNACKFRANDAWDTNWGSTDFPFGTGTQGGADIPVPVSAAYSVTFNSNSGAYEFSVNSPIGIIGNATPKGWDEDTNLFQDSLDANKFYHVLNLKLGEAKFRFNDNWDRNWGSTDFPTGIGTQNGANIPITSAGRYRIDFDTLTGAYAFTLIPEYTLISVIGDATPGGWDNDTPLSQDNANPDLWVGNVDLTVGSLKFRADSAWTSNWGGTTFPSGTAVPNGPDNIPVGTAGRYQASIDVKKLEYNFLVIRPYQTVGIIGTANPGGFDNPTPMTEDPNQEGLWKARVVLKDGDLIFKADDDLWSFGDFPTGIAELDGAPIPITAGEYKIEFNQITGAYSFELLVIYGTVGLIGPATPLGNWDTDVDMTKDANDEFFWFIPEITLNDTTCKFRAEDAWTVNWGAASTEVREEPSGIATQDGVDFKVKAGVYGITLRAVKNEGEYMFGAPLSAPVLIKRTSMNLSPNPTKNVLNIELIEPSLGGEVNLTIFNNQGVRVYANTINIQEYATIQLGDMAPGVYWLHMTNGKYFAGKQFIVSE